MIDLWGGERTFMKDKGEREQGQAKNDFRLCFWSDVCERREGRRKKGLGAPGTSGSLL
jgi:hypothetical protein